MKKLLLRFFSGLLMCATGSLFAQGTAFSYHGRLNDSGNPANGSYDFIFTVYDAAAAGNDLAAPVPLNAVGVTNGQFNVQLDFGAGVFTGPPRWLQISVRTNGVGAHIELTPRQALLPTPYAIRAGSAGFVADGGITPAQLNIAGGVPAAGQVLGFDGNAFTWRDAGVGGGVFSLNGTKAYYNGGNVGIGTDNPDHKLTLRTGSADYGLEHTDGTVRLSTFVGGSTGGGWLGTISNHKLSFFVNDGSASMTVDTTGNVGIGIASPLAPLHMWAADSVTHVLESGGGTNAWARTAYKNANGGWDVGTSRSYNGDQLYFYREGSPSIAMGIQPNGDTYHQGTLLRLYNPDESATHVVESGGGINAWSRTVFRNAHGAWSVGTSRGYNGDQLYFHREGSPNIALGIQPNGDAYLQGELNVNGTTRTKVLTITGGADVAEPFKMSHKEIPTGAVVVIDEENPGQLKMSGGAYDRKVAGIISGANGVKPGITLHQEGLMEGDQNVALSGRVYVLADAAHGAIKAGDLLTTSDTPGHAMRVVDYDQAQGAILGKAMTGLKDGKGTVLVLVTLQ